MLNWELDYTSPPYEDCTDGDFISERQFNKGDILNLVLEPGNIKRRVRVVISIPGREEYKTYFNILNLAPKPESLSGDLSYLDLRFP